MKNNKKLTIIISIIIILAIIGVVFAYLFIATDIFKGSNELFAKYFAQNKQAIEKVFDIRALEKYKNLEYENKYESNTVVSMVYSEGGEISNPLNDLSIKLDIQKDDEEQYKYIDGKILFKDEEYIEAEIIKEQEQYGIRFIDAFMQFITVKDDESLEEISDDLGIDVSQMKTLLGVIDSKDQITEGLQLSDLKQEYIDIVTTAISSGTFEKQRNAMITYNNITTKTNAYSVLLSNEQVGNIIIDILKNIKSDTQILDKIQTVMGSDTFITSIDDIIDKINNEIEIPTIKITVYEQKQKTIRTDIEMDSYKISIENVEQDEEIKTIIYYSNLNSEQITQYNVEIIKKDTYDQEDFQIIINAIQGDETRTITISNQMKLLDNKIEMNTEINCKQDITTISILIDNDFNIDTDFDKRETLEKKNYIPLNNLNEQKRKELISLLEQIVPQKISEKIVLLEEKFENNNQDSVDSDADEMSQAEINKFNAKFEFYTGDEVSVENIKTLINVVKENLRDYEIETNQPSEDSEIKETKTSIKLYIDKDETNDAGVEKVLEEIKSNKKYKVLVFYKESNGLIDYITITEN